MLLLPCIITLAAPASAPIVDPELQLRFAPEHVFTITNDHVSRILATDVEPGGNLLICDADNVGVHIFSAEGKYLRTLAAKGIGEGAQKLPLAARMLPDGTAWVADGRGGGIKAYDPEGRFVRPVCPIATRSFLPLDDGGLVSTSFFQHEGRTYGLGRFSADCTTVWHAAPLSAENVDLAREYALSESAVVEGPGGRLYHTASYLRAIIVLDRDGKEVGRIGLATDRLKLPPLRAEAPSQPGPTGGSNGFHIVVKLLATAEHVIPVYLEPFATATSTPRWSFDLYAPDGKLAARLPPSAFLPIVARPDGTVFFLRYQRDAARPGCPCDVYRGKFRPAAALPAASTP